VEGRGRILFGVTGRKCVVGSSLLIRLDSHSDPKTLAPSQAAESRGRERAASSRRPSLPPLSCFPRESTSRARCVTRTPPPPPPSPPPWPSARRARTGARPSAGPRVYVQGAAGAARGGRGATPRAVFFHDFNEVQSEVDGTHRETPGGIDLVLLALHAGLARFRDGSHGLADHFRGFDGLGLHGLDGLGDGGNGWRRGREMLSAFCFCSWFRRARVSKTVPPANGVALKPSPRVRPL